MSNSEPSAIVLQGIACICGVYKVSIRRDSPFPELSWAVMYSNRQPWQSKIKMNFQALFTQVQIHGVTYSSLCDMRGG
jgi:hypothetical protein